MMTVSHPSMSVAVTYIMSRIISSEETIGTIFRGQLFGVYRCDLNGESLKALYDSLSGTIALSGNSLYYQHYSDTTPLAFHKVDIAGKKDTKISDTPYSRVRP